jgi:hypothetical protein
MNFRRLGLGSAVRAFGVAVVIGVWAGGGWSAELPASMKQAAIKVQRELDRIEVENLAGRKGPLKTVDFTETEFNAWLAFRLDEEKEDVLRELALKLFPENRIEGKAFIDLSRARLPLGFKPKFNLYFSARILVQSGEAKIEFTQLFIEGQRVSMPLLDLMIATAAGLGKSDAAAIKEWVLLPYGLKNLRIDTSRVRLYY